MKQRQGVKYGAAESGVAVSRYKRAVSRHCK